MLGNKRKTIGVFISQVQSEFQDCLSKGIITKANELDYNTAFFTNFGGYGQQGYDKGEAFIADLPQYEDLSGIVIVPDIMVIQNLEARYIENIKNKSTCPVVSVRRELKEYYSVLVDDNTVLDEIIRHFIEDHKFTRINFLAGPKGFPDSDKRLAAYKRIMAEHNLPVEEERIYYGDFWKHAGNKAVDYWLKSPLERPQAIICANDYMALTVCTALSERDISVPQDIAVTGCDDVEDSAEFRPSLTTVRMPVFEMGMEAVDKINRHNLGMEQPKNSYIKTITVYRKSCGCNPNVEDNGERIRNHIAIREELKRAISRNAYMSTDLAGLTTLEEVDEKLWAYIYENSNFSHFCMCLQDDWDVFGPDRKDFYASDDMLMEVGFKNRIGYSKLKCSRKNLIPDELVENKPMAYYFALLHHQEHYFGYIGISFDKVQTYMETFQAWLINVSNALENVRIHNELKRLIYRLEDMSIRDDLTGLYNRHVIDSLGKKYLKRCVEEQVRLMVFTADMDKLKYINDKFGHTRGDLALRVVSDALMQAADDDEICIRLGGDEFMAIGTDYDESKLTRFVNRFVDALNKFNFINDKEFGVYVSYGCHLAIPDENTTIEGCLSAADTLMYLQKGDKADKKLRINLVC